MTIISNGIEGAASRMELDLMPDHSVRITIRCDSAMEAGVLFEDISETAKGGSLNLSFGVTKIRVE